VTAVQAVGADVLGVKAEVASTKAEVVSSRDDIKKHVAEHGAKRAMEEIFHPTAPEGATTQQKLDAYAIRHRSELAVVADLRAKRKLEKAEEQARPKPKRARAASSTAASSVTPRVAVKAEEPKPKRVTAASSTGDGVPKRTNPKQLCGALCVGTRKAPGERFCKQVRPCRFHVVPAPKEDPPAFALQLVAGADLGELDATDEPGVEMSPVHAHMTMSVGELFERAAMSGHDKCMGQALEHATDEPGVEVSQVHAQLVMSVDERFERVAMSMHDKCMAQALERVEME